jgi:hypothetical protein
MGLYGNVLGRARGPANREPLTTLDDLLLEDGAVARFSPSAGGGGQRPPMHHPFHVHGAGRFLTVARDRAEAPNLVWSDTVLVRTGETVDIIVELTNPGVWMAHRHIAEHDESGMMVSLRVDPAG